jgi:hypothetical protein
MIDRANTIIPVDDVDGMVYQVVILRADVLELIRKIIREELNASKS